MINIIMSTYNGSETIKRALSSIEKLSLKHRVNVYSFDDGSKDNTLSLLHRMSSEFTTFDLKVFSDGNNKGASYRRNQLLNMLNDNEWVLNLDQDDEIIDLPDVSTSKTKFTSAIYMQVNVDRNGILTKDKRYYNWFYKLPNNILRHMIIIFPPPRIGSTVFNVKALKEVGGFGSTRYGGEDWSIFYKLITHGYNISKFNKTGLIRYESGLNTSILQKKNRLDNFEKICQSVISTRLERFLAKIIFKYRKKGLHKNEK